MKIMMVSLDFPPTVGGISAHVYELSKAMAGLGHRVSVLTRALPRAKDLRSKADGIDILRIKLRFAAPLYGLQLNRFINKSIVEIEPDIVHVHGMAPLEGLSIKDVPLAYTNHTSGYLKRIKKGGIRRMALIKRSFKKPSLFLAPSRELLETPFPLTAKKEFISNGVDAEKYRFNQVMRDKIRKEFRFAHDDKVAILTRRLVQKNGVSYLAKSAAFIQNPDLKFIIIGDGEERDRVETYLTKYFSGRFFMLGAKTHDEIIPYYSAADFSILPSLFEATSISGLEAMAAGLPLVGTRVGGIPELIHDGDNGYLCRPEDEKDLAEKIDRIMASDLKEMGRRSREMVEKNFSWDCIAKKTMAAYGSIL